MAPRRAACSKANWAARWLKGNEITEVAFHIQIEFQLFAPGPPSRTKVRQAGRIRCWPSSKAPCSLPKASRHEPSTAWSDPVTGYVRCSSGTCPVSLTRVASPTTRRSLRLLLACPRRANSPRVVVAMCVSKLVVSNASTSADNSKCWTAARAISICAFSSCSSVTWAARR